MHFKTIRGPEPKSTFDLYVSSKAGRTKVVRDDCDWKVTHYYIGSRVAGRVCVGRFFTDYELRSEAPDMGQW